jgi:GH24 family phage-related lysozyme (muramidase)
MAAGALAAGGGPAIAAHLEAQLAVEEGNPAFIYDDAVGAVPFKKGDTLKGNLTVGTGINLMGPWDAAELKFLEDNRIARAGKQLAVFTWYQQLDPVRQTAVADIVFNVGFSGLLHWPHFLSAMASKDYARAGAEIKSNTVWIAEVHPARAGRIEAMIETGNWPADIKV